MNKLTKQIRRLIVTSAIGMTICMTMVAPVSLQGQSETAVASNKERDSILALPRHLREHMQTNSYVYERYKYPLMCFMASKRANAFYFRDKRPDTLFIPALEDTVLTVAKRVAEVCSQKFSFENAPTKDLTGMGHISLALRDEAMLHRILDRLAAELPARDSAEQHLKASKIANLAGTMVGFTPLWRDTTILWRMGAAVDTLGNVAARVAFHLYQLRGIARATMNADLGLALTKKSAEAFDRMITNDRLDELGYYSTNYSHAIEFLDLKYGRDTIEPYLLKYAAPRVAKVVPADAGLLQRTTAFYENQLYPYQFFGQEAPAIPSRQWFYAEGLEEVKYPHIGTPTFFIFLTPDCRHLCMGDLWLLKYLNKNYHERGLRIVLVTKTSGYFRSEVMESNEDEIEKLREYYLNYLKLPVTLVIDESRFSKLPDGRRMAEDIPWRRTWPHHNTVLLDSEGKFYGMNYSKGFWEVLKKDVDDLLKKEGK